MAKLHVSGTGTKRVHSVRASCLWSVLNALKPDVNMIGEVQIISDGVIQDIHH